MTQACPTCNTLQELPAVFCWMCGAPLMKVSKWFITFFLSVTAAAYGIYGLYSDSLFSVWPIPLYLYYVFLFICLSLILTRRYYWTSVRVFLWSLLLLYAMSFLGLSTSRLMWSFSADVLQIVDQVRDSTFSLSLLGAVAVFNLLLGFIVLTRRFNFTLAYRIFLTFAAAAAYVGGLLTESPEIGEPMKLSRIALWLPDMTVSHFLGMTGINLMRAVAAEMVVYSLVMSFGPANLRFRDVSRKILSPTQGGSRATSPLLQGTAQVAHSLVRAGIYLQFFFITLGKTLANYAWGMYRVIRRLTIDLVAPVFTLAITAFLLGIIAEHTASYLTGYGGPKLITIPGIESPLAMIGIAIAGVVCLQMIFLAAVTKFSWADLWRCNALLVLWIGPFFFAVFVFISVSLIATGSILKRWGHESFPYHFGPLTITAAVALLAMVAFALLYPHLGRKAAAVAQRRLMLAPPPIAAIEDERGSPQT